MDLPVAAHVLGRIQLEDAEGVLGWSVLGSDAGVVRHVHVLEVNFLP